MNISCEPYGRFWNQDVELYSLENTSGVTARFSSYGCLLTELHMPDAAGNLADVVLGCGSLPDYLRGHPFFGAVVGRCANRIPGGRFTLDGVPCQLSVNAPFGNHQHGGVRGFDKYVWKADTSLESGRATVTFTRTSAHLLEEGYPGELHVSVAYSLDEANELTQVYTATTDLPTIVNLVNHSYFNLAGHDSGDVAGHELQVLSEAVTPCDERFVPTGEIRDVAGTPYDFREPRPIGKAMAGTGGLIDVNYVLAGEKGLLREAAVLRDPSSGRTMRLTTTAPGLQVYNSLKLGEQNITGKHGRKYPACAGLCLETQDFPNAVNTPQFPSVVLRPGEIYRHVTVYSLQWS